MIFAGKAALPAQMQSLAAPAEVATAEAARALAEPGAAPFDLDLPAEPEPETSLWPEAGAMPSPLAWASAPGMPLQTRAESLLDMQVPLKGPGPGTRATGPNEPPPAAALQRRGQMEGPHPSETSGSDAGASAIPVPSTPAANAANASATFSLAAPAPQAVLPAPPLAIAGAATAVTATRSLPPPSLEPNVSGFRPPEGPLQTAGAEGVARGTDRRGPLAADPPATTAGRAAQLPPRADLSPAAPEHWPLQTAPGTASNDGGAFAAPGTQIGRAGPDAAVDSGGAHPADLHEAAPRGAGPGPTAPGLSPVLTHAAALIAVASVEQTDGAAVPKPAEPKAAAGPVSAPNALAPTPSPQAPAGPALTDPALSLWQGRIGRSDSQPPAPDSHQTGSAGAPLPVAARLELSAAPPADGLQPSPLNGAPPGATSHSTQHRPPQMPLPQVPGSRAERPAIPSAVGPAVLSDAPLGPGAPSAAVPAGQQAAAQPASTQPPPIQPVVLPVGQSHSAPPLPAPPLPARSPDLQSPPDRSVPRPAADPEAALPRLSAAPGAEPLAAPQPAEGALAPSAGGQGTSPAPESLAPIPLTAAPAAAPADPGPPPPAERAADLSRQTPALGPQLAEAVARFPDRPVELTLSPEELGRVRLTLSTSDGGLVLAVTAERPETLDLMRRNIDQLARDFREIGFSDLSFSFTQQDRRPQADPQAMSPGGSPPGTPASPPSGPAAAAAPAPHRPAAPGGLDLRI